MAGLADVPNDQKLTEKFENLVERPEKSVETICEFTGLPRDPQMTQATLRMVDPAVCDKWLSSDPKEVAAILPLVADTLAELGYMDAGGV